MRLLKIRRGGLMQHIHLPGNITIERFSWVPGAATAEKSIPRKIGQESGTLPVRPQNEIRLVESLGPTANHDPVLAKCRLPMAHPERDHCSSGFKASVNGEETAVSEHSNSLLKVLDNSLNTPASGVKDIVLDRQERSLIVHPGRLVELSICCIGVTAEVPKATAEVPCSGIQRPQCCLHSFRDPPKQWLRTTDILSQKLQRSAECARYGTHQDVMKFTTSQVDGRLEINKFIEANQSFHPKNYLDTVSCQTDVLSWRCKPGNSLLSRPDSNR
ncbi:hypothetical protein T265_06051 [Opisthorchis viverrini]|uniref:Uncharacterized protein n=1 Tax=Opisthorchis viverrini TaxID=6198 RepID=A0A074ZHM8_OPIVI|nr:hypothetical protein T265_06051 [Opisthorchis viverrini]KER26768.1 hypothetical protein T265_06051 [Opisthorchis viverrini]